jgi:uncharacterized protein YegL
MHFIWIVDASTSMRGEKIQSLNYAIANALPEMRKAAADNPYVRVLVRALRFATHASWMSPDPIPLTGFQWHDIDADGETAMGEALALVADEMGRLNTGGRFVPPVLILVTDGHPTDRGFDDGLRRLLSQPLGREAIRLAVAIGSDADVGRLQEFIAKPDVRPLQAGNADTLAQMISFASKSGIALSSKPGARTDEATKKLDWVEVEEAAPARAESKVVW